MTNATITLSPESLTAIAAASAKFCRADTDRAFALHEFMRVVGDAPTYDNWQLARGAVIQGYLTTKPAANEDAQNKHWSRYVAQLRQYVNENGFEMAFPEKPKAETPAAQAMAAKRANPFKDMPRADVEKAAVAIAEKIKAGDKSAATAQEYMKAVDAIEKTAKAEAKALEKASTDATKKRRENVCSIVKACTADTLALFEALTDATCDNVAPDVQAKAWAFLVAAMPKSPAKKTRAK